MTFLSVLTERLQKTEKEKLQTQTKLAEMTLDGERLICKLRSKEKELAMLENHRAKLETCVQMLTAGDPVRFQATSGRLSWSFWRR